MRHLSVSCCILWTPYSNARRSLSRVTKGSSAGFCISYSLVWHTQQHKNHQLHIWARPSQLDLFLKTQPYLCAPLLRRNPLTWDKHVKRGVPFQEAAVESRTTVPLQGWAQRKQPRYKRWISEMFSRGKIWHTGVFGITIRFAGKWRGRWGLNMCVCVCVTPTLPCNHLNWFPA